MKYIINGACQSVIGNVRENNEDNYYFNFKTLKEENNGNNKASTMSFESIDNIICAVFDGMGGESNGERASYLAANSLNQYLIDNVNNEFLWNEYIKIANQKICNEMHNNIRMGSTLAAVRFTENFIDICNLGDSKIFGLKNKDVTQLSQDHTDEKLQKKLNITGNKSYKLTQHFGIKEEEMTLKPYIKKLSYNMYDKILICTDGLTDMVSNNEIAKILSLNLEPKDIVDKLINATLSNGGKDNTTIIVLEIRKEKSNDAIKRMVLPISIILIVILLIFSIINNNSFKIIIDDYGGAITVGESYIFKYRGNYKINIDNDNIEYKDNYIIAKKAGTSTITIIDKNDKVLYTKTIKIFPN